MHYSVEPVNELDKGGHFRSLRAACAPHTGAARALPQGARPTAGEEATTLFREGHMMDRILSRRAGVVLAAFAALIAATCKSAPSVRVGARRLASHRRRPEGCTMWAGAGRHPRHPRHARGLDGVSGDHAAARQALHRRGGRLARDRSISAGGRRLGTTISIELQAGNKV